MEYAVNGNLQELLRRQRSAYNINDLSQDSPESNKQRNINLQLNDLKRFGLHVASGMEYIASREVNKKTAYWLTELYIWIVP